MQTLLDQFSETIRLAGTRRRPLRIRGSGSKDFYGGTSQGDVLDVSGYRGIVDYAPEELVLTARAGTLLHEIEAVLADQGQMLPFEPPHFGPRATLGGCVAAGLSGPRRASSGAVRDFVLGVRMMNGLGEQLQFGGQVMKNVAGYDVSRLMAGSLGTLGLLLEVSLKVLPKPKAEATLQFELNEYQALEAMNRWAGQPYPLSATCYHDQVLTLRLSGTQSAIQATHTKLGGQLMVAGDEFWHSIREQTSRFFRAENSLWRVSLPSTATIQLPGKQLIEWSGALRWLETDAEIAKVRAVAAEAGGQATLFRGTTKPTTVFHPLPKPLLQIHQRMKRAFDPQGVFNIGRMYPEF